MSKYGELSRSDGNAKWFLQRTLVQHDKTMDHPWMQMIYNQQFTLRQYCTWLAMNRACFKALEAPLLLKDAWKDGDVGMIKEVHKPRLLRTRAVEVDLKTLLGASWIAESDEMASSSKATQQYLSRLAADAEKPANVLAHHFLMYNAVLSGGAFLGEMVSQKFCIPHGVPGVQFYAFDGVKEGHGAGEVQSYLKDFNSIQLSDEDRKSMLQVCLRVYEDQEGMMQECYEINPQTGLGYRDSQAASKGVPAAPEKIPDEELLQLDLSELHCYTGANDSRIVVSLGGELIDLTSGAELYGPGCGYHLFAGHDVTKCLATMSLEPADLDDLDWTPTSDEDQHTLNNWLEKLKAKYPVAGSLKRDSSKQAATLPLGMIGPPEGLRQRAPAAEAAPAAAAAAAAPAADGASQTCPISGKEGVGCPMSMFGIDVKTKPKAKAAPKKEEAKTGFMKGKSMIAHVEDSKPQGESFIYKLCPLHWDDNTTRLLIAVAAISWVSGIFIGWNVHRQWMQWTVPPGTSS